MQTQIIPRDSVECRGGGEIEKLEITVGFRCVDGRDFVKWILMRPWHLPHMTGINAIRSSLWLCFPLPHHPQLQTPLSSKRQIKDSS